MAWSSLTPRGGLSPVGWLVSLSVLLAPTVILGALAYRTQAVPLAVGAGVQVLFALVFLRAHPVWRPPASSSLIVLYLIALAWVWLPTRGTSDGVVHIGQGVLLLVAVGLAAVHD